MILKEMFSLSKTGSDGKNGLEKEKRELFPTGSESLIGCAPLGCARGKQGKQASELQTQLSTR